MAIGKNLAVVVKEDYPVAQEAPPLLGMTVNDVGGVAAGAVGWRTAGLVGAHRVRLTHSFLFESCGCIDGEAANTL